MEEDSIMKMKISEVAGLLGAEVANMTKDYVLDGVERDSRQVKEGNLYLPMRGARFDSHSFIETVIDKGVKATLWSKDHRPLPEGIACILVEDTIQALRNLASAYLRKMKCRVIAVTGSNGKTSIKDMCHAVLSTCHRTAKTPGNYNNDIGLPLSILDADPDVEYLVLEMGMDHPGDIRRLVGIAPPDVAIISNIGTAHLLFMKSRENIAKGKLEILEGLKPGGLFIRNGEEPLLNVPAERAETFGYGESQTIYPTSIRQTFEGIDFDTNLLKGIHLNTFGRGQVENAMAVILMARNEGIAPEKIRMGLEATVFTKNRNDLYAVGNCYIYDDSYKSNPEGLNKCLETMCAFDIRRVAVLSDMAELGETEEKLHREVAHKLKECKIDKVYLYGELSKYTYEECLALGVDAVYYENKESIARDLVKEENALILFKASNCMRVFDVLEQYRRHKDVLQS